MKRCNKSINVGIALSVREGQAIIDQELAEAQNREEMLRPKRNYKICM